MCLVLLPQWGAGTFQSPSLSFPSTAHKSWCSLELTVQCFSSIIFTFPGQSHTKPCSFNYHRFKISHSFIQQICAGPQLCGRCPGDTLCSPPVFSPHSQRNHLSCKLCLSPVYNLSMPLILGNESKLCTVKPCIVDQSYLASCYKMQKLQPQWPTSTFLHITVCPLLECPTSSSICPQIPLSTNASLWISL